MTSATQNFESLSPGRPENPQPASPAPSPSSPRLPEPEAPWSLRTLDELLIRGLSLDLSDLILTGGQRPWFRRHGAFVPAGTRRLSPDEVGRLLTAMAGSEAAQAIVTSGQDFDFSYELGEKEARKRFRVNATAVARGRSTAVTVSLRAVPGRPPKLSELDIEPDLKPHLCPGDGLVLITGVMGSGKSTLAASILRDLAEKGGRHIASYEAPVEFDLTAGEGLKGPVEQSEIPAHLPSFSAAPRNAARRAADVIFLGESRDRRALRSLIEAAGLGALAYTTAHTRGAAETPLHLINLFQASERAALAAELISVLKVIVQQRLFPRIGGGRVAVREYVILDQPARRKLLNLAPARLEAALAEQLAESGQSLTEAASKKAEEGLIDPGIVRILRAERGGR